MEVKFADYRFLREKLVLYKRNELVPLKRNQAVLLDFFLSDPEGIHSKETIMDSVWQGKVVSEQVVFQTISQLRAILGDEAIKTFPKKGYKWQLSISSGDSTSTTVEITSPDTLVHSKTLLKWLVIAFSLLAIAIVVYTSIIDTKEPGVNQPDIKPVSKNEPVSFHVLYSQPELTSSQQQFNQILNKGVGENSSFLFHQKRLENSVRQAFSAPKLVWQQASLTNKDWLIWGDTYSSEKGTFLHFGLAKKHLSWQGYLFAKSAAQLKQKLAQRLKELQAIGLFSVSDNKTDDKKLDIHTLTSMHQISPNDPDLLLLLAKHYISVQHLDVALTYLQKLESLDKNYAFRAYQAQAQWYKGKVYKMRRQHLQAKNSLETMSAILSDTPLWPLSFHNIKTNAWLAYDQTDYDTMFKVLDSGIELGERQADPLTLFELHIMYSILAQKASADHKKYFHLNQAQALLLKHNLDNSNLAIVYFHFALFSRDKTPIENKTLSGNNASAIPYLERILELPRTAQNYWVQDDAIEMLVNYNIENKDFTSAHQLFGDSLNHPKKLILKAKVYLAEEKSSEAIPLLQKAFELARLDYDTRSGLQAALMLYQLSTVPQIRAEYLAYIKSNARPEWLKQHNELLAGD
ncbi:winged helix-turn-helix domain-containing protein [Aliikangiella coralliicola]|uniref:OmpR/PhoB-type domain-containing protein n=1 Tax=Aliikangiella coralliicola TaxID=2592383 RepID=A0A545UGY9_9GAMM|nr:winged helix-turn-helix domain-containing protein [Aliikangiella coralliicola]TQV88736.1 hypothetical protein FLL46_04180 [Aliikangiella coralliicola]